MAKGPGARSGVNSMDILNLFIERKVATIISKGSTFSWTLCFSGEDGCPNLDARRSRVALSGSLSPQHTGDIGGA